jgi:C4-type Zn-finger protein
MNEKAQKVSVEGITLACPICKHDMFLTRQTLMNTPAATFFGLDWANRQATNHVCDKCGHVLWFLDKRSR